MRYSINKIKSLEWDDINEMTQDDLKELAKDTLRNTKRRLSNLQGYNTPAKYYLEERQGNLKKLPNERNLDSMDVNKLKKLVNDTTRFLKSQTSTLEGERRRIRNFVQSGVNSYNIDNKTLQNRITRTINKLGGYNSKTMKDIFEVIEKIENLDPTVVWDFGSPKDNQDKDSSIVGQVIEIYTNPEYADIRGDAVLIKQILDNKVIDLNEKYEMLKPEF